MESTLKKRIVLIGIGVVTLVCILGFVNAANKRGKVPVRILVAPSSAQATIDGKKISAGTVYLKPGDHTLAASLENFTNNEVRFTVRQDNQDPVGIAVTPANADGKKYLKDNPDYQLELEGIAGLETEGRAAVSANPLITLLPYINIEMTGPFSVNYGQSALRKDGTAILISESSPRGRVRALQWIRDQGFEPSDYEIQFTDYVNPLNPPTKTTSNDGYSGD